MRRDTKSTWRHAALAGVFMAVWISLLHPATAEAQQTGLVCGVAPRLSYIPGPTPRVPASALSESDPVALYAFILTYSKVTTATCQLYLAAGTQTPANGVCVNKTGQPIGLTLTPIEGPLGGFGNGYDATAMVQTDVLAILSQCIKFVQGEAGVYPDYAILYHTSFTYNLMLLDASGVSVVKTLVIPY